MSNGQPPQPPGSGPTKIKIATIIAKLDAAEAQFVTMGYEPPLFVDADSPSSPLPAGAVVYLAVPTRNNLDSRNAPVQYSAVLTSAFVNGRDDPYYKDAPGSCSADYSGPFAIWSVTIGSGGLHDPKTGVTVSGREWSDPSGSGQWVLSTTTSLNTKPSLLPWLHVGLGYYAVAVPPLTNGSALALLPSTVLSLLLASRLQKVDTGGLKAQLALPPILADASTIQGADLSKAKPLSAGTLVYGAVNTDGSISANRVWMVEVASDGSGRADVTTVSWLKGDQPTPIAPERPEGTTTPLDNLYVVRDTWAVGASPSQWQSQIGTPDGVLSEYFTKNKAVQPAPERTFRRIAVSPIATAGKSKSAYHPYPIWKPGPEDGCPQTLALIDALNNLRTYLDQPQPGSVINAGKTFQEAAIALNYMDEGSWDPKPKVVDHGIQSYCGTRPLFDQTAQGGGGIWAKAQQVNDDLSNAQTVITNHLGVGVSLAKNVAQAAGDAIGADLATLMMPPSKSPHEGAWGAALLADVNQALLAMKMMTQGTSLMAPDGSICQFLDDYGGQAFEGNSGPIGSLLDQAYANIQQMQFSSPDADDDSVVNWDNTNTWLSAASTMVQSYADHVAKNQESAEKILERFHEVAEGRLSEVGCKTLLDNPNLTPEEIFHFTGSDPTFKPLMEKYGQWNTKLEFIQPKWKNAARAVSNAANALATSISALDAVIQISRMVDGFTTAGPGQGLAGAQAGANALSDATGVCAYFGVQYEDSLKLHLTGGMSDSGAEALASEAKFAATCSKWATRIMNGLGVASAIFSFVVDFKQGAGMPSYVGDVMGAVGTFLTTYPELLGPWGLAAGVCFQIAAPLATYLWNRHITKEMNEKYGADAVAEEQQKLMLLSCTEYMDKDKRALVVAQLGLSDPKGLDIVAQLPFPLPPGSEIAKWAQGFSYYAIISLQTQNGTGPAALASNNGYAPSQPRLVDANTWQSDDPPNSIGTMEAPSYLIPLTLGSDLLTFTGKLPASPSLVPYCVNEDGSLSHVLIAPDMENFFADFSIPQWMSQMTPEWNTQAQLNAFAVQTGTPPLQAWVDFVKGAPDIGLVQSMGTSNPFNINLKNATDQQGYPSGFNGIYYLGPPA